MTSQKHHRLVVTRFLARLKNASLVSCLNSWKVMVATRSRVRALCSRLFGSAKTKTLSRGFVTWHRNMNTMTGQEAFQKIKELEKRNLSLTSQLTTLTNLQTLTESNLSDAQKKKKQAQLTNAHNLIASFINATLSRTYNAWKSFATASIRGKSITRRFVQRWENKSLYSSFTLWKGEVAELLRHEQLVIKYASRIINATMYKLFTAWTAYTVSSRRYRVIVDRFRRRLLNVTLTKSLNAWLSFMAERRRLQSFTRKWFARAENLQILASWNAWIKFVNNHARFEALSEVEQIHEGEDVPPLLFTHVCGR